MAGVRCARPMQVLVIVGFGFLYSLMRRYAWSGISYSFLIAVLCLQVRFIRHNAPCASSSKRWQANL